MKTGIIVARFQASYLHEGHTALIRYVKERNERVIIFIGTNHARLTYCNPLSYEARELMVKEKFPEAETHPVQDHKYDSVWSTRLDKKIEELCKDSTDIVLYGSRNSFLANYYGKYRTEFYESPVPHVTATQVRMALHDYTSPSQEWRKGVIFASTYKYPTSYQTVDVAIVNFDKRQLLMGKKDGEDKFRFIGGFVDVDDENLELAAKREVHEECGYGMECDGFEYIGSYRVDDWRYKKERDKIMTAFFLCHTIYGTALAKAQDDITELKWFELDEIWEDNVEPEHHLLLRELKRYLIKKQ